MENNSKTAVQFGPAKFLGFDDAHSRRISFILPTKNRAKFLESALGRARELVGPEDELIVIDGASSDNTAAVVNDFGNLINIFISEPDSYSYEASNKGLMLARGKYVYIMSDDDVVYREGIEKAVRVMDGHPEIDLLVCGGIRQYGSHPDPYWFPPGTNYGSRPENAFIYKACGMGFFYRRRTFAKFGMLYSLAADGDFVCRVIYYGGIVKFCRIKLFNHTIFDHSSVRAQKKEHRLARCEIAKKYCSRAFYLKYYIKTAIDESVVAAYWRRAIKFIKVRFNGSIGERKAEPEPFWDGGFS